MIFIFSRYAVLYRNNNILHYLGEQLVQREGLDLYSALFYSLRTNIASDFAIRFMSKIIDNYEKILPFVKTYNTIDWTKNNRVLYVLRKTQALSEKIDQNSQAFYIEDFSSFFHFQILGAALLIYLAQRHFNLVKSPANIGPNQKSKQNSYCEIDIKNLHHIIFEALNSQIHYDWLSRKGNDNVSLKHQAGPALVEVYKHSIGSGANKFITEYTSDYVDTADSKTISINNKMSTFRWVLYDNCFLGPFYATIIHNYDREYGYHTKEIKVIKEYVDAIMFIIKISTYRQISFVLWYFANGFKTD